MVEIPGKQTWTGDKSLGRAVKDNYGNSVMAAAGQTLFFMEKDGAQFWTTVENLNGAKAVKDENDEPITYTNNESYAVYLVEVGVKRIWTTNTSLGTVVNDSDGNPRTKTTERSSYNGIVQRLSDILNTGLKSIKTVSGSTADITEESDLNNLLRELQTKMSNFQRMMQAFETRLYKKYDAMESSLALLGAQLNYVTGAFQ